MNIPGYIGEKCIRLTEKLGDFTITSFTTIKMFFTFFEIREIIRQIYFLGVGSIIIILVTGLFTGMVLSLQGYYTLVKFGADSMLGSMVALSVIKELGPVLGAFMIAGRAGSSVTAEIGIMRVTEQMDALEMMAVNSRARAVMPKIISIIIVTPLLISILDVIALVSGYGVGVHLLEVNEGAYIGSMISKVSNEDIMSGLIKGLSFGLAIGTICAYLGLKATKTTEGIAKATTRAVVLSSISILTLDYIITSLYI